MSIRQKTLSVSQAAALCGVGRTTVGYWIRSNKLRANRIGRNYSIPVQDLLYFLKSTGQKIPPILHDENLKGPIFKSFQHCWEYWQGRDSFRNCEQCIAFQKQLEVCFTAKNSRSSRCSIDCDICQYYVDIFLPRIHFVNQIDVPAAVIKDLYFWCGNSKLAQLCEVSKKDLIGKGIEEIVHPSSLALVIASAKRRSLGDFEVPEKCTVSIKNERTDKLQITVGVYPLIEPEGAFLVLAE
ncbi:MAG: helix-turn-helix domain-containing protein [Desulfobacterales bacterium]|nr:MAG: helix-turn-helix domain-containing protein [Desulfobacterales bacterium]